VEKEQRFFLAWLIATLAPTPQTAPGSNEPLLTCEDRQMGHVKVQ